MKIGMDRFEFVRGTTLSTGARLSAILLGIALAASVAAKVWLFPIQGRWALLMAPLQARPIFWLLLTYESLVAAALLARRPIWGAVGAGLLAVGGNMMQWLDPGIGEQSCGCVGAAVLTPGQHVLLGCVTLILALRVLLDSGVDSRKART